MHILAYVYRIAFFSIAVFCALILTTSAHPLARKYRKQIIAVGTSSFILGILSVSSIFFLNSFNPNRSTLVPIDALKTTEFEEPISNPETELPSDETAFTAKLPFRFKYKLKLTGELKKAIAVQGSEMIYADEQGTIRGFNAYTGLNHWAIHIDAKQILDHIEIQKKLFLLDLTKKEQLRVSCFDTSAPALLWQRTIPGGKEGSMSFDNDSQSIIISTGNSGIWSLMAKTGEVFWKRPEIFSKNRALVSSHHLLVFEPVIVAKNGSWYFLDRETGKTLQKTPHLYGEIESFTDVPVDNNIDTPFLGRVNNENYFSMNRTDLSQIWSFHAPEKIDEISLIDQDTFLMLYSSHMIELRKLKTNDLLIQKKLSEIDFTFVKHSPDHSFLAFSSTAGESVNKGVSFFDLNSSLDYIVTATMSEPVVDTLFFGDWMYLMSANTVWSFKR